MFVVLLEGAQAAAAESSGSSGLMEAFKTNPTFLSINIVVRRGKSSALSSRPAPTLWRWS